MRLAWTWLRHDSIMRLWIGVCALALVVEAQIKIVAPRTLAQQFAPTHGMVYGTTATFGAPYYGTRILGRLLWGNSRGMDHCSEDDYDVPTSKETSREPTTEQGQPLVNIIMVRRGQCTFVSKVRVAEKKNAHAVVIVDKATSKKSPEDIQRIVMADDGWGNTIRIPSVMISSAEGQKLIDAAQGSEVVLVELAWDIPQAEVVLADFWMSSASRESAEFLIRFRDCAEILAGHLQFVPHYHVFSMPYREGSPTDYAHLCTDSTAKHCAPDPDGPGPITGAMVVEEDLRQLCIWKTTARVASEGVEHGATYSKEFWEYTTKFPESCPVDGSTPNSRFGTACSFKVMQSAGIDGPTVQKCVIAHGDQYLDAEIQNVAWSPQALRLNGWRYSGPLDPEVVLKAICSGYAHAPVECQELMNPPQGIIPWIVSTLTFGSTAGSLAFLLFLVGATFMLYKRHMTKSVRSGIREEVMLEVQTQMSDYREMRDTGASELRPLSF